MICKSCRDGADYVSGGGTILANAHFMHRMCQGSTRCDCQHRVEAQAEGKSVQA